MKHRYRAFRRGWGVYYCEDIQTGKQSSLNTTHKLEALRLVHARNEGEEQPALSLQLARIYWRAGDPAGATRTWQQVMEAALKSKANHTRVRWDTAIRDRAFDSLRHRVVLETGAEDFLRVLQAGTASTNIYLRRIHNLALDLNWLPWPVIPRK